MADRRIRRSGVTTTRRIADRRVHGSSCKNTKLPSDCTIGLCLYQTTGCNTWGWWASTKSAPASTRPIVQSLGNYVLDRKSTRLNSSHSQISYAVFCLKKKKKETL